MSLHVIVGAGAVGAATALLLTERGDQVKIVTRSGGGPEHPAIERVAADASDAEQLTALAHGAVTLYNCANPAYGSWLTQWPPLASSILSASERTGATLATAATLYGYGPVDRPMTEVTPLAATHPKLRLRADMSRAAFAAHDAGRIRATEVRASDYIQGTGAFGLTVAKPVLNGKRAVVPFTLDQPHSFTSVNDVAIALITAAEDERGWGRAWHAPTNPPLTLRQLASRFADIAGAPTPKLIAIPYPALWTAGVFVPIMRELRATHYQWERPFILDSSATEDTFGLKPQSVDDALREAAK